MFFFWYQSCVSTSLSMVPFTYKVRHFYTIYISRPALLKKLRGIVLVPATRETQLEDFGRLLVYSRALSSGGRSLFLYTLHGGYPQVIWSASLL